MIWLVLGISPFLVLSIFNLYLAWFKTEEFVLNPVKNLHGIQRLASFLLDGYSSNSRFFVWIYRIRSIFLVLFTGGIFIFGISGLFKSK